MSVWTGEERRKGMNGEQIISEIKSHIAVLETKTEERQKYTCSKIEEVKGSIENLWQTVNSLDKSVVGLATLTNEKMNSLDKATTLMTMSMNDRVLKLPCLDHDTKIEGLFKDVNWMRNAVLSVIIGGIVMGVWLGLLKR